MADHLSYSNKHGSYQFEVRDNVVICELKGALGVGMAQHYYEDLKQCIHRLEGRPFVYIGYAKDHEAATPNAEEWLLKSFKMCLANNAVGDAYCMSSAMAIAQIGRLRKQCGMPYEMQEVLFDDLDSAITSLQGCFE